MSRKIPCLCIFLCALQCFYAQTIKEVAVNGNVKTNTDFLKGLIATRPDKGLDSLTLENDLRLLKRLPSVAHATYQVICFDESCTVQFDIQENYTLIPSGNIYTTNNGEFAIRAGVTEFNLLGRNIALGGFYQNDIYNSFNLNLEVPFLFGNRWGGGVSYQKLSTLEPVFFDDTSANYKYTNKAAEVAVMYHFDVTHQLRFGTTLFKELYEYQDGATSESVPLRLSTRKLLYKLVYGFDKIDYHFFYLDGIRNALHLQHVTSFDEDLPDFSIVWNDFQIFKRVGEKGNLAGRVRLGISSNTDTPFAPFSVDNNINIRGVGNTIDRGTAMVVVNAEYRQTLIDKGWFALQGNAFIDSGSWRNPGGELSDLANADNVRVYPGFGVRLIHKRIFNAILRVDFGFGVTKDASNGIVFGIGQYF